MRKVPHSRRLPPRDQSLPTLWEKCQGGAKSEKTRGEEGVVSVKTVLLGDALERLHEMDSEIFHCCVTSPPYYNLRDYGTPGQIGMEETPERYIENLVQVFRGVRRVLRPDGTLWINIGDSYATSSGPQPPTNTRNSQGHTKKRVPEGYKRKDLIGIPWMLAFALRADGWYLRQDIIWQKPNAMPESVRDRCTKSHEYIFLLSKSPHYYFDAAAISEPIAGSSTKRYLQNIEAQKGSDRQPGKTNGKMKAALPRFGGEKYGPDGSEESRTNSGKVYVPTLRRNKRDVWAISTGGFKGAHFAVFPERLVEPCILAGCPEGGTVLDPFTGSGTTGVVAKRLRRNFVGVEINPEYWKMATDRINATVEQFNQITMEKALQG